MTTRAALDSRTVRGPDFESGRWMCLPRIQSHSRETTSPRRYPISISSRMTATMWGHRNSSRLRQGSGADGEWREIRMAHGGAAPANPGRRSEGGCHDGRMYGSWRHDRVETSTAAATTPVSCTGQSVEFWHWKRPLFGRFPAFEIDYDAPDVARY